ncbi:MAG TPA: phosphotransferase [Micromonosporaceae bacterium]|nr:phosphotransferase [Micromonosporaceae bacterium]
MPTARAFLRPDQLTGVLRAAYGPARRLAGIQRLRGGSKKGVYRLALDTGASAILYAWSPEENFWPARAGDGPGPSAASDPFSDANGLALFTAAHDRLRAIGVRTPGLVFADASHAHLPADLAIVEDVPGGTLEDLLEADPASAARPLAELADALAAMSATASSLLGKVAMVEDVRTPTGQAGTATGQAGTATGQAGTATGQAGTAAARAPDVAYAAARAHLAEAAARVPDIAAEAARLDAVLERLTGAVDPRDTCGMVHGELGPDHVMVDADGHAVLIDIEGLMYFDVEWEHVFLRIRFGERYPRLRVGGLDQNRLRLYALAQHLSLVAGPLRIADGDFPERDFMLDFVRPHR